MSCCNMMMGFDFAAMDRAYDEMKRHEKEFICGFENDHLRKVLKKLRKQFHIEEIAFSGDRGWYFEPETGDMVQFDTGCKYRIRYWHHDPDYSTDQYSGKVKHFYCF